MMGVRGKLRTMEGNGLCFWCPGCNQMHVVTVAPHPASWGFNGDFEKPTFTPSVLVRGTVPLTDQQITHYQATKVLPEPEPFICHSFVTDGRIQFLCDCTHALAGQTVDLPIPEI